MVEGRCNCGKVHFHVERIKEAINVCHCSLCRRMSGHLWAGAYSPQFDALRFTEDEGLTWYASSDFAKRGFCKFCGSSLFFRLNDKAGVMIAAGCLEAPFPAKVGKHIFVKDKGDYYEIGDDAPQIQRY